MSRSMTAMRMYLYVDQGMYTTLLVYIIDSIPLTAFLSCVLLDRCFSQDLVFFYVYIGRGCLRRIADMYTMIAPG
jgi:hypothetical protein